MPTRASKKKKRPRDTNVLAWQVVQEATGQAPPEPEDTRNPAAVALAALFKETCAYLELDPDGLVLHSDNGGPMKGSTMLATLQRLGVVPSFSRPHVSDDNPYSEALFRTLKYRPEYPSEAFSSLEHAREWTTSFVTWYNTEHRHSAIRFVTPDERHEGRDKVILAKRHRVYQLAREKHPERWSGKTRCWEPVETVTLNPKRIKRESRCQDQAAYFVVYITTASNVGTTRFGDYVTIRREPQTTADPGNLFSAFGYGLSSTPSGGGTLTDLRYVLFGRPASSCQIIF